MFPGVPTHKGGCVSRRVAKMTQAQTDIAVVQGWKDAALAAREQSMADFYERILVALREVHQSARRALPEPEGEPSLYEQYRAGLRGRTSPRSVEAE